MAEARLKIADKVYDVPTATLGELRQIKQHFGVTVREFAENALDPDVIAAMAWLSIKRANPAVTIADIDPIESVELLDAEDEPDPTPAAEDDSGTPSETT